MSGVFERVLLSSDDWKILEIGEHYGVEVIERPKEISTSTSPDLEWVNHAIQTYDGEAFAILRPTSPFRTPDTIRRAYQQFTQSDYDSLRAVELVAQRPEKMWRRMGGLLYPYLDGRRMYEQQSSSFESLWVQNGCLEMARMAVLPNSVSGQKIGMFETQGYEGFDINTPEDLAYAQWLIHQGYAEITLSAMVHS